MISGVSARSRQLPAVSRQWKSSPSTAVFIGGEQTERRGECPGGRNRADEERAAGVASR